MKKGMCLAAWSVVAALLLSLCGCGVSNRVDDRYRESVPVFDFCYASQPTAGTDTAVLPVSYKQAAENNWLRLYLDKSTGGVAVADRRSGKVWSSIPAELDKDTVATADMQELIRSVLRVDYYDGDTLKSLYSYTNCVNEGGLTTEKTDDGVRLIFSLSLSKATYDDLPKMLSAERYTRFFGDTSALTGTEKSRLEKYFTWDDAAQAWVLGAETAAMVRSLPGILKKVGYTTDDLKADSESMGFAYNPSSSVYFDVTVDYRLQNDSLLVDVPLSALKYNPDYPPDTLQLNEFLLHSDHKGDGYMLIPDGSGALVDFSAGTHDTGTQEIALYGNDKTLSNQEKTSLEIGTVMPVYGIREGDNGVLAIIEDGDVMAKITAQKANTRSTYNVVGTRFTLSDRTNAMIGDGSVNTTVPVSQSEIYGGSLRTRYVLLAGGGTYSDMAACYKAYLMQRDGLKLTGIAAQPELYLETIGAITRTEEMLGFQYEGTKALTTFKQAQEILKLYTDAGVSSVQMISTGALKGGVDNYSLNRNDLLRALGGSKDFAALSEAVEAQNGTLYLGINALAVPRESGHINRNARSARTLDQSLAKKYEYNLVTQEKEGIHSILSVGYLPEYVGTFVTRMADRGVKHIAMLDMGRELYADYNKSSVILRQSAKKVTLDVLKDIRTGGSGLLLTAPMMDAVSAASGLVETPLYANNRKLITRSVPFLPLVLSGLVPYAGEAYNEVDNREYQHLKTIETGASLYFSLFYAENTVLRNSEYTYLTSNHYRLWLDDSIAMWKECQTIREKVQGACMVRHEEVTAGVYCSVYSNGVCLLTNYNSTAVTAGGCTVGPMDYVLTKEG